MYNKCTKTKIDGTPIIICFNATIGKCDLTKNGDCFCQSPNISQNEIKCDIVGKSSQSSQENYVASDNTLSSDIGDAPFKDNNSIEQKKYSLTDIKAAHYAGWYNGLVNAYTHTWSWHEYFTSLLNTEQAPSNSSNADDKIKKMGMGKLRDLLNQFNKEEISISKFLEEINNHFLKSNNHSK